MDSSRAHHQSLAYALWQTTWENFRWKLITPCSVLYAQAIKILKGGKERKACFTLHWLFIHYVKFSQNASCKKYSNSETYVAPKSRNEAINPTILLPNPQSSNLLENIPMFCILWPTLERTSDKNLTFDGFVYSDWLRGIGEVLFIHWMV